MRGPIPFWLPGVWTCEKVAKPRANNPHAAFAVAITFKITGHGHFARGSGTAANAATGQRAVPITAHGTWTYWRISKFGHPALQIRARTSHDVWLHIWVQPLNEDLMFKTSSPQEVRQSGLYIEDTCRRVR
ncbi:MAG: hypothetical protein AAF318_02605 [Pseudomonadota bacterium]